MQIRTFYPRILNHRAATPIVLMLPFVILCLVQLLGLFMLAHAADEPPALGASLVQLLTLIKDKGSAVLIVVCVFQILRTDEAIGILGKLGVQGKTLKVLIAVSVAVSYVGMAYAKSGNLGAALIEGLFVSGAAMRVFDAFKAQAEAIAEKKGEVVVATLIQKKAGSLKA